MDHEAITADGFEETLHGDGSMARWQLTATTEPGRPIQLVKLLAYHWAPDGEAAQALVSATRRGLDEARALGFDQLALEQRAALDELWAHADIELDGDPEIQHALRYALFQLHQNAACTEGRGIPAKGLTGPGYSGHTFWDTEIFLLPVLSYCAPRHAEDALRWRASTLPQACAKARQLGLRGAAFAWRTIAGEECSGYMPAGTAAFHVNAAIAHAAVRHAAASGDADFERETGAPLLVETARMWASLGYHDERRGGRFSIDGVTGPDEYTTLVDNNLYTNLMAQANLRAAAELVDRLGHEPLDVEPGEVLAWRRAADAMTIPYDNELGIHLQDEDFTRQAPLDFAAIPPEHYPLLLHVPYFQLYRRQVVKQPDLVLAMALCGDAFTDQDKRRNLAYYEPLTVRDSSLSAGTQAVLAAEVGDTQLAYDYLAEAILLDHHNSARNTADGLHLAALAGGWSAVINGLAGMRDHDRRLSFQPAAARRHRPDRLPACLPRTAAAHRDHADERGVHAAQRPGARYRALGHHAYDPPRRTDAGPHPRAADFPGAPPTPRPCPRASPGRLAVTTCPGERRQNPRDRSGTVLAQRPRTRGWLSRHVAASEDADGTTPGGSPPCKPSSAVWRQGVGGRFRSGSASS